MTHHSDSDPDGRNIENTELSLSEILTFDLVDRMCLSVSVNRNKYCTFGWVGGHRKSGTICGKFAMVIRRIWQTGLWNLEKFAAENCGPQ